MNISNPAVQCCMATNGDLIVASSPMTQTVNANGDPLVQTITNISSGVVYIRTRTYTGQNTTTDSGWVRQ